MSGGRRPRTGFRGNNFKNQQRLTFSPDTSKGRRPSIESARGVKRSASNVGLQDRESEVKQAAADPTHVTPEQEEPKGEMHVDQALLPVLHQLRMSLCSMYGDFVENPEEVASWFAGAAKREAFRLKDYEYDKGYKQWPNAISARAGAVELPCPDEPDDLRENETYLTNMGQMFKRPPEY